MLNRRRPTADRPRAVPPRRLRRPTLLVVGCGDVGLRLLALLAPRREHLRLIATARREEQLAEIRKAGALPLRIDLDSSRSLRRLAGLSRWLVHLAPPAPEGETDPRTRHLIAACAPASAAHANALAASGPARWAYVSTSGVYGDCRGAWVDESRPARPVNARARRRVAAEDMLRDFAGRGGVGLAILRAPGIYAQNRLPTDRLRKGLPALARDEDGYTNHIHADDLAFACWLALFRCRAGRVLHVTDDTRMRMGDYFDTVADACALPRPPRLPMTELVHQVSPMMLSFMNESRRLHNDRMKRELRLRLRYPDVHALLRLLQ